MRFYCDKNLLQNAVSIASRTVPAKNVIPALEGILIEAKEDVSFTGYNLETGIKTSTFADISEKGAIVINARLLNEIIRRLPDESVLIQTDENLSVTIKCGVFETKIMGISAEDYPEMPKIDQKNSFSMEEGKLKDIIAKTIFSASENDSRPVYMGALFDIDECLLTVVAVDGYRLALKKDYVQAERVAKFSFIIPAKALKEVEKIASDSTCLVTIKQGENHIIFSFGDTTIISRLLEGEFLNYRQAIPRNNDVSCIVNTNELYNCIEIASPIINDGSVNEKLKSPIRFKFGMNKVQMYAATSRGTSYGECKTEGDGKDIEIGFNNRFMLEALKAVSAEKIKLQLNNSISPCIMVPAEGEEDFLYMVLPVRLKA